jgi:CRP-like cAMP-binding protein
LVGPLERALYLRSMPLFRDLGATELAACAQLLEERAMPRGTVLYGEHEGVRVIYLLVEGRVQVARGKAVRYLEPPDAAGLVEFLSGQWQTPRATATTDLFALAMDPGAFLDLLEDHFPIFLRVRQALGKQVADLQHRLGSYHADMPSGTERAGPSSDLPIDPAERLLRLQRAPIFRGVGLTVLAALMREQQEVRLHEGQLLWERGDDGRAFALVVQGAISCEPDAGADRFRAGSNAFLGVEASFGGTAHAYRAVATEDTVVLLLDTQLLIDLAEDHVDLALQLLAHLSRELLRLQELAGPADEDHP